MKQYQAIELKNQWMFIVKGLTFKDCVKQVEKQLGYKPDLFLISSKQV